MKTIPPGKQVWHSPFYFIAFGFGSGLAPVAPGTCGTLAAIPCYFLLMHFSIWLYGLCLVAAFILGVKVCGQVSHALGVHDHSGIVWDEIVGYLLTMWGAPHDVWAMLLGFVFFRIFDIVKPWPIRWIDQKISGGLGIMLDDVLAALPAWLLLQWVIGVFR